MAKGHIVAHRVLCRWFVGAWRLGCLEDITLFSLTKNLVYKNIEAQICKKIRTIIKTLSASQHGG